MRNKRIRAKANHQALFSENAPSFAGILDRLTNVLLKILLEIRKVFCAKSFVAKVLDGGVMWFWKLLSISKNMTASPEACFCHYLRNYQ